MNYQEALKTLTEREQKILECKCNNLKDRVIWEKLHLSEAQFYIDKGNIYAKLGLKDIKSTKERLETLQSIICPIFFKLNEPPVIEAEVIEDSVVPPLQLPAMILDQESYILAIQDTKEEDGATIINFTDNPEPVKRNFLEMIITIAVFAIMAGVIGYFLGSQNKPQQTVMVVTATTDPMQLLTQTALAIVPNIAPTFTATAIPTSTPTIAPTATIQPTDTSVPTPTATFMPPANGMLFHDDFNNGISSGWTMLNQDWLVSNGELTLPVSSAFQNVYEWIGLEHPDWKNYKLSLDLKDRYGQSSDFGNVAIAVRTGSQSKYIGVQLDENSFIYWANIGSSVFDSTEIAGRNTSFNFSSGSNVEITVQDNNYTLQVNGQNVQTISMLGYDSGGIRLGIDCESSNGCPTIDNVKVTYLP